MTLMIIRLGVYSIQVIVVDVEVRVYLNKGYNYGSILGCVLFGILLE